LAKLFFIHYRLRERKDEEKKGFIEKAKKIFFACCYCSFFIGIITMIIVNSCDDYKLRNEYNKMPGFISSEMSRVVVTPNSGMYTRILKNNM